MRTIHKFPIIFGEVVIKLPVLARVVDFAPQNRDLFIWVDLYTSHPYVERRFQIFATSEEIPAHGRLEYVKTAHVGSCVWHLMEHTS